MVGKSDPHPPLATVLVTVLREDGGHVLSVPIFAFVFHFDSADFGETVVPRIG